MEDDTVDIKFLSDVITARYEEIFEIINQKLIDISKD
jgi:cell division ATPase FtsA